MGANTNATLQAFADRTGIHPATGASAEALSRIAYEASQLIGIVALEQSGIRDGDGYWHGSDALAGTIYFINEALFDLEELRERAQEETP